LLVIILQACPALAAGTKAEPLTPWQLRAAVVKKPTGKDLERLRDRVYATFGEKELEKGVRPRVQETMACWAIAISLDDLDDGVVPKLVLNNGLQQANMQPLGQGSNVFVLFGDLQNFTEVNYLYMVGKKRANAGTLQVEHYTYEVDSLRQDKVPQGKVTKAVWKSKIFADTVRDYYVYVPAQYDPKGPPACVMVFQDGAGYLSDVFRTATVFDNLIHKKEIPVIIGIFINPGKIPKDGKPPVDNRSVEYDTVSDKYARFLRDEILPEVGKKYKLRKDAASRAICGISSGGICAFTVAWEMPDMFGKVMSHVGSFTDIRGGHVYPSRIRKSAKKDIRVYLQWAVRDLDNVYGNWPLANQQMAAALRFKGYDYTAVMGQGFHSGKYGGAHLPSAMRWLWRDYKPKEEGEAKPKE
jgi:enterochelin esterase family protein